MFNLLKVRGKNYLFGSHTNRFQDREQEILTDASHRNYEAMLNFAPQATPELRLFHSEDAVFDAKAVAWGYDGAFFSMLWELSETATKTIEALINFYGTLKMSHGFQVMKRDGPDILEYFTNEVSLLPPNMAANWFTDTELLTEDFNMTDEQFEAFAVAIGPEKAKAIIDGLQTKAQALDESGVASKSVEPDPEIEQVETTEPEPETAEIETDEEGELVETAILSNYDAIQALTARLDEQQSTINEQQSTIEGLSNDLKALTTKKETKSKTPVIS
jgi:uncharacterized coiled-coil protein SlyX